MITFERKIYQKLLQWKAESQGNEALLIEGARRVGKSTVVETFAQREYKSYILIDFNDCEVSVKKAFDKLNDLNNFFAVLFHVSYHSYFISVNCSLTYCVTADLNTSMFMI